eukprot:g3087.t2
MLHRQTKLRQSECLRISQPYLTELKSSELRMTKKERNEKRTNKRRQSCYRFRWKRTFASLLFLFLVFKLYSLAKEGVIIHIALWKALDASEKASVPIQKEEDKIPKVAMLFLSTNPLHNEPIWRAFFEAAGESFADRNRLGRSDLGRLSFLPEPPEHEYSQQTVLQTLKKSEQSPSPTEGAGVQSKDSSREEQTNSGSSKHRRQLMTTLIQQPKVKWNCTDEESMIQTEVVRLTSKNTKIPLVIQNQNLFSVYVNSDVYLNSSVKSIFSNSAVVDRIDTKNSYAQFTLVAATIQLLRVALRNPLNKKFILLSESCIPIRPPEVIHAQLITEKRSRVHACQLKSLRAQRWDWRIIEQKYWRKSSQFFALRRDHAEIAVEDEELQSKFKQYCFSRWEIRKFCVSDEHFFGTLLAKHGRENEVIRESIVMFLI